MKKFKTPDLAETLLLEGKIIERRHREPCYTIVEAFGQRYKIEYPDGRKIKITQLVRNSE